MSVPLANWLVVRNVVVTGGSRGLGLGVVRKLAAEGYHAIAVARQNNTQLASAINHAKQFGPGALDFVPYDLGEIQGIAELVRKLRKKFGHLWACQQRCHQLGWRPGYDAQFRDRAYYSSEHALTDCPHQICGSQYDGGWSRTDSKYRLHHRLYRIQRDDVQNVSHN
jgi:hypothetical protein